MNYASKVQSLTLVIAPCLAQAAEEPIFKDKIWKTSTAYWAPVRCGRLLIILDSRPFYVSPIVFLLQRGLPVGASLLLELLARDSLVRRNYGF